MTPEAAYRRVRTRPPRCLAGFDVRTASPATRAVHDLLGGNGTFFEILPPSDDHTPTLLGRYLDRDWPPGYDDWMQGRILVSPLALRWNPSGDVVELFDGSRHGYNPEHDLGPVHQEGQTDRTEYRWPGEPCRRPVFVVVLSHTFEETMDLEGEEAARPEDFFDWLVLAAWSAEDGRVRVVTEFKCT